MVQKETYMKTPTAALWVAEEIWKPSGCPSLGKWTGETLGELPWVSAACGRHELTCYQGLSWEHTIYVNYKYIHTHKQK